MIRYPLVGPDARNCPLRVQLPLSYMEDFSILGLRVSDSDRALFLLRENAYTVVETERGTEVELDDVRQIGDVLDCLHRDGIRGEITDVVEAVYQG